MARKQPEVDPALEPDRGPLHRLHIRAAAREPAAPAADSEAEADPEAEAG